MLTLALDVDGVLLDPERGGAGHWTNELTARFGIEREQLRAAFFSRSWSDVIEGRRPIESCLGDALAEIGSTIDVESVLSCWFEADYVPIDTTFELARRAADAGCRVVLATNQEHRRARYLSDRIGTTIPIDQVLYSADLGYPKHDARFFETASERLGVHAAQLASIIFVDDVANNVEVARTFGWQAVHAHPDSPWHDEVANLAGLTS